MDLYHEARQIQYKNGITSIIINTNKKINTNKLEWNGVCVLYFEPSEIIW